MTRSIFKQKYDESEIKNYWDRFYKYNNLEEESPFCNYIMNKIDKDSIIIDIGCGSGRDTLAFYKAGFNVIGLDGSKEAINNNKKYLKNMNLTNEISYKLVDLSDKEELSRILLDLTKKRSLGYRLVIYSRFLLHSVKRDTQNIFLQVLSGILIKGDLFVSEFRTIEDEKNEKYYKGHYRRYINSEEFLYELQTTYKFDILEFNKGTGFSVFKEEDPYLARIIAEKA